MLKGKEIVLGGTGGIAAYKAAELVRLLVKQEARVRLVMTRNGQEFITPLTFQTLSGSPVVTDPFALLEETQIGHITLADLAELIVILPATANIIGKIANGIADDFLTPMGMRGELSEVLEKMEDILSPKDLKGRRILVTAGPTQESIDPVRFITNHSSGKMGYALAKMARRRGAEGLLGTGPTSLPLPRSDIKLISVKTAEEMRKAVFAHLKDCSVVIKAAAVSDYRPKEISRMKLKKTAPSASLELERTRDILGEIGKKKGKRILVGFAAETEDLISNARKKLKEKNLDLIVVNDVMKPGAGFASETNQVKFLTSSGEVKDLPLMSKEEVSQFILDEVISLLNRKSRSINIVR